MEFVDHLYDLYKDKLTGDEEDALIIIEGVVADFSNQDIEKIFRDLSEEDRFNMVSLFLYEKFRQKVAKEGIGQTKNRDDQQFKYYH
ncbi:DUF6154 family protein [Texcoconibacillus texcoconensis]|uniref:O-methyltransferase involved in polyketide biosynthesis n=1 Tax=Texcoconibacillus texcoconensis TaxID=1095777 RepID=A0A840QS18_9BACI|nr:DUF6154 family protein [Texcoconibacillus texcoconensis]MBB5174296.1 O-methyltransferase involved in polyketide biosynthesis [Texcoconibacillus texcoconensis]